MPQRPSRRGRAAALLRSDAAGGVLLLVAAAAALVWANTPAGSSYARTRDLAWGPAVLDLHLTVGAWASDGLLAIFFFVAGLELKQELLTGRLRGPRRAVLPVAAAVGGMAVPALVYLAVNAAGGRLAGWAVPTATDIAFALAVLALVGRRLPPALRAFLLAVAVVDDLLAILIIAFVYTSDLRVLPLVAAVVPFAAFAVLADRCPRLPWLLLLPALATWALVHASGVHATVAGLLLALAVPVTIDRSATSAARLEHLLRPVSTGFAVPVFAFFAAGVVLGGRHGIGAALHDPVTLGIVGGLVAGKTIGIAGTTWLVSRVTGPPPELRWTDVLGLAMLGGIGFTVSLLIGGIAFGPGSAADDHVKVGVLLASALAALAATVTLRAARRKSRRIA